MASTKSLPFLTLGSVELEGSLLGLWLDAMALNGVSCRKVPSCGAACSRRESLLFNLFRNQHIFLGEMQDGLNAANKEFT